MIIFLLLLVADQATKYLAAHFLQGNSDLILIPGVFQLSYLENTGSAWGMMQNMQLPVLILTFFMILAAMYLYRKCPRTAVYGRMRFLLLMLMAGAVGNAIDRIWHGYVIDFLYFSLIHFPVFNVADCYICMSLFLLVILYRNEDFLWLKKS